MSDSSDISHVTDTALWVAALRATEGRRRDAVFHDDLAGMLAGDRGQSIARTFPQAKVVGWSVVLRTAAIDRLIEDALRHGVDTVINLGAGMDTRPYRLILPPDLRWVEIDFSQLIEAKVAALEGRVANCRVERIGMDLMDGAARLRALAALGSESRRVLLIAEGVVPYFSNEAVASLAADCLSVPAMSYWILDFDNAGARKTPARWVDRLRAAPVLFQVADWFKFFESCGWHTCRVISSAEESERLQRPYPLAVPAGWLMRLLPRHVRRRVLGATGAVLLERA